VAYTLKITDGSTTVDLTGTDGYQVVGEWAPQIATRRKSKMGGRSPYNDVEEQMTIVIKGTSTANALSKSHGSGSVFWSGREWDGRPT
jgi:hypothetical protein